MKVSQIAAKPISLSEAQFIPQQANLAEKTVVLNTKLLSFHFTWAILK